MNTSGIINQLSDYIAEWRERKGFYTPNSIIDAEGMLSKLMLVVTEVAEAAESVRHGDQKGFEEEIADTMIRLMDICGTCKIDIDKAICDKMKVNERRLTRHGKVC